MDLIRSRYMLEEDLDAVLARAASRWAYATASTRSALLPVCSTTSAFLSPRLQLKEVEREKWRRQRFQSEAAATASKRWLLPWADWSAGE